MTGIIILAAGSSSRLGTPKQALIYHSKTLLQHTIEAALKSNAEKVMVVTGYGAETLTILQEQRVCVVYNNEWRQGMASSMQAGLSALLEYEINIENVIVMLCDQPFVTAEILNRLMALQQTFGKAIAACKYKETLGVPALFNKRYFPALLSLHGSEGAKKVILQHQDDVAILPFEPGAVDIDTLEDYNKLLAMEVKE